MAEKIATREAYGKALVEMGAKYENLVVLDADLAAATKTGMFKKAYPDRFIDCGIAENNMIGVAAGLALLGKIPFASSFAMFLAGRSFEQVRNSVGYPHINVKLGATHAGATVGEDGATHQCIEDFALMRALPGMLVCCPCDGHEMRLAVEALINYNGPAYLRLARPATEIITDEIPGYSFELGKGATLCGGKDVTIIATGIMVPQAMKAAEALENDGISARVIDMHTIKPLDAELVVKAAKETGCIVTAEEHSVIGGLGSAVCELLSETCPTPVLRLGVNDEFGRSGKAAEVLDYFNLNAEGIAAKAREAVRLK